MSGHSHWATIKRAKTSADQKRGMLFTKLGNAITIATRLGSPDPEMNFKLKIAIENARKINMPKETIERAIKRGAGEIEGLKFEDVNYEVFAPGGVALIISSLTSNKNRTVAEVKRILNKYDAGLAGPNSVAWMFERKGIMKIQKSNIKDQKEKEEIELKVIEYGAENIEEGEDEITIYTKPENLQKIKESLEKENIKIDYATVELEAKNKVKVENKALKEKLDQLFLELDESEEVNDYFTNLE